MIRLLSLLALLLAVPAASQPAARPWTAVARPVASGSYLIGNPAAKVRLVEYLSYTCPHCAHFLSEGGATLKAMVRSGSLSIEVRNQVHDRVDLAAATLARCAGPAAFPAVHDALFAQQEAWLQRAMYWDQANASRLALYPELAKLRAVADGAGLTDIARAAGVNAAAIDACFAKDVFAAKTLAVSNATSKVRGTPAFEINGRLVENVDWAALQPMLRAAGAK
ncbi:thioredoxin domain-containing protein [Sphingomonas corticis]|jgi:protein-disulfide isomerase|uniref:Thioredoxin domain-containing protein n=1 Tax=Sphingomonas corticis TaxID=2722791 RepID=A0ABX1CQ34_9SPHN|nr:thioredoxin domain-containing protein [Sphingomonas corticis]NJR78415.1 thioredoxin domain-containing protein [Sphingomonas corticis]